MSGKSSLPFFSAKFLRIVFNKSKGRNIITNFFDLKTKLNNGVTVIGDGPLSESEMKNLIRKSTFSNIDLYTINRDCTHVILGSNAIENNKVDLQRLFEYRRGQLLKVFSQEMIIIEILFGLSPDEYINEIDVIGESKTLKWLSSLWPDFIHSDRVPNYGIDTGNNWNWDSEGPLGFSGYHVGKTGIKNKADRREILLKVWRCDLPSHFPVSLKRSWGDNNSIERLIKIAETISLLYNRTEFHSNDYSEARRHWLDDFNWLKTTYYNGNVNYSQGWPQIQIGKF